MSVLSEKVTKIVLPLEGCRVIDFGWVWAGHACGQMLADLGAEVIKIESGKQLDPARQGRPIFGDEPDPDQNPLHHNVARNKLSVAINLKTAQGKEIVKRLVAVSDIVVENMSPHALRDLGLSFDDLREVKRDIIMISYCLAGQYGPSAEVRGYGPTVSSLSGLDSVVGYPGQPAIGTHHAYGDPNVGLHAAFAVLAALHKRDLTGEGEYIDLSMWEAMLSTMGLALMDYAMNGVAPEPCGNTHPFAAPHGVFPCQGEDEWVSITVRSDEEWAGLRRALGSQSWSNDERFADQVGRLRTRDELNARVADWTSGQGKMAVATLLQAEGVAAAPCLSVSDRLIDEQLSARDVYVFIEHPRLAGEPVFGSPLKFSETPVTEFRHAPLLGEHTAEVLGRVIGMSAEEIELLTEQGVLV